MIKDVDLIHHLQVDTKGKKKPWIQMHKETKYEIGQCCTVEMIRNNFSSQVKSRVYVCYWRRFIL